ncbi:peptide chain release factor N(5)-glutamine methyltransferase [Testudinibacter aquarius]|uniref:Release factor glutamine methyltransferase n=2 Tax=Testudinibacter aquarius TaxID=1524974 RepID=A0A4R3YCD0_9PAST|nr:peptide chain release factor N(5)-glutamine methyltransferase [Testudinibacter aquarius]TCV89737.1 release factor glutamine methyltransferase [Testudinibacter aquarius]TNG93720.1 peptide chain release factor N(5)-glutamine methyltransferase [Testudinibacter aquarius]
MKNKQIQTYWQQYCQRNNIVAEAESWAFAEEYADYLLALVLAGQKTATCAAKASYLHDQDPLPSAGEFKIILDSRQQPGAIIKLSSVEELPMNQVSEVFALAEGEGDYATWYRVHQDYFTRSLSEIGITFSDDLLLVCERFDVLDLAPLSYDQWLAFARRLLQQQDCAKLEALMLLQHLSGKSRSFILAFGETLLSGVEIQQLTALLLRRLQGEPMAYILGEREFWNLTLKVSEHTLIPRPDTEILVEKALELAAEQIAQPTVKTYRILDLGTGTGAIALALAKTLQQKFSSHCNIHVTGLDKIPQAVELAKENQQLNGIENVTFLVSDWFTELAPESQFDMIVSNPPYIDQADPHLARGDARFEPLTALVAEQQGLADLNQIIQQAKPYLRSGGWLLLEHGWQQGQQVRSLFTKNAWQQVETVKDYADNDRVTLAQLV